MTNPNLDLFTTFTLEQIRKAGPKGIPLSQIVCDGCAEKLAKLGLVKISGGGSMGNPIRTVRIA